MTELTDREIAQCRFEAECEVGLWEPYWEEVEFNEYTDFEVRNHPWPCDFVETTRLDSIAPTWVHGYRRPECKPRTVKVKRWRWVG